MSVSESPQLLPSLDTSLLAKDDNSPKTMEREERLRITRERLREEQRRRLEELRESMERAEEFRRKQEENRRQKIEEMRKRDEQHRASVEERRKKLLDEENERKQAIVRKTEAKLEQTKQKKISGFYEFNSIGGTDEHWMRINRGAEIRRKALVNNGQMVGDPAVGQMSTARRDSDYGQRRTSLALFSYSSVLNASHTTPLGASDFRSTRNLESSPYENNMPAGHRRTTVVVRRKRLSSSVDQIAGNRVTISESQSSKLEVEPSSSGSNGNGSASPFADSRAKSMGSIRKSRADLRRTTESLQPVVNVNVVNGKATPPPAAPTRNLASTRTGISKSVSSSEALGANSTLRSAARSPAFPRPSVLTPKFSKGPPVFSSPPAKLPLSPSKTLVPWSLPKPSSSQRSITSNKGIIKAVHDLSIRIQSPQFDKKKELPVSDVNEKQKGVSANGEPSAAEMPDKTGKTSVEEEYKAKLTEKRRLAREKAEREAEEERQRVEEERRKEEERLRIEEEEQRKQEEEELRAVEEARKQEEERFRLAVEETERQRKEEEEKQTAEREEKLAAERRVQEEAERKEKERDEKTRREEEERLERKKRLEMIMKRVKTDDSSSQKDVKEVKATEPGGGDDSGMKSFSPFLRQVMDSKLRGKVTGGVGGGGSSSALSNFDSSNDESKTLQTDASSESVDEAKANPDELLREKSDASPELSEDLQPQRSVEETVNEDSETIDEAKLTLHTSKSTHVDVESGIDSCIPTMALPFNEDAVSDDTQSTLEVINLSSVDSKVTKASDDNQNWTIPTKDHPDPSSVIPEQSLPDLPRIAFDENSVKNSQNKLPDILL